MRLHGVSWRRRGIPGGNGVGGVIRLSPRSLALRLERKNATPAGDGERFRGFGVMGLPFTLGHILAFRRFGASTIGPPFTSLWHRAPDGRWTFYVDADPALSCPRYFGAGLSEVVRAEIRVQWCSDTCLSVSVPDYHVEWALRFEATAATRVMSALASALPDAMYRDERLLRRLAPLAGRALDAGAISLMGRVPNGQRFAAMPRRVWAVSASAAVVRGRDVGPIGPLPQQVALGDFILPNRGLLAFGDAWFEPLDPARHLQPTVPEPQRLEA